MLLRSSFLTVSVVLRRALLRIRGNHAAQRLRMADLLHELHDGAGFAPVVLPILLRLMLLVRIVVMAQQ